MDWYDITWELRQDEMIKSCGCDGLVDAYYSLKGLYHMWELGVDLKNEFILEVINSAIDGRNRYCGLNGAKKLEYVKFENGEFVWDNECYV